jgi:hypothetical protein
MARAVTTMTTTAAAAAAAAVAVVVVQFCIYLCANIKITVATYKGSTSKKHKQQTKAM